MFASFAEASESAEPSDHLSAGEILIQDLDRRAAACLIKPRTCRAPREDGRVRGLIKSP